jgi:hypothetical protein
MKFQFVTDLPLGYDDETRMTLGPNNEIIITHPVMPPMIYDEQVMRWTGVAPDIAEHNLLTTL